MNKSIKTVIGVTAGVAAGTGKTVCFSSLCIVVNEKVGTIMVAPFALGLMGFTTGGIAAGSVAAGLMSSAAVANGGGVAAGSLVAILQSVGAAGFSAATTAGVASTGGVIGGMLGWIQRNPSNGPPS